MRKLMVALAAVALAMGVNAAQVDWKLNVAGQGAEWKDAGAYVMAFNGSDYTDVINLLTVTGSDNMATDLAKYSLPNGDVTQFAVDSNRGTAITKNAASTGVTGDTMFWVVFTEGSMDAKSAIQWTAVTDISASKYEAGTPALDAYTFTAVPNVGEIAGIPEPTSALLLVLGMAGLALKRKRA